MRIWETLFDSEFGRFVTDNCTFSWFCDFIIENDYHGKGLGKWMLGKMLPHPKKILIFILVHVTPRIFTRNMVRPKRNDETVKYIEEIIFDKP